MNLMELVEKVTLHDREWYKIIGDNAFVDVLDGYFAYEPHFKNLVKSPRVAIQAGGYCGIFSHYLSQWFETVYTFEPDALNFFCLVNNAQKENVIKTQGGLGSQRAMAYVNRRLSDNCGMHQIQEAFDAPIPVYRIDDLKLRHCDLIQLDTEGYELNILHGASNTINEFRPVICVEDATDYITAMLRNYKYQPVEHVYRDTIYVSDF